MNNNNENFFDSHFSQIQNNLQDGGAILNCISIK